MQNTNSFVSRFAQALVKNNIMKDVEAESFVKEFKGRAKGNVVSFLLEEGLVEREDILKSLALIYSVPAFDVNGHFFNHELLLLFPKDFLIKHSLIPLDIDEDILTIVISNPEDEKAIEEIGNYVNYNITVNVGIQDHILEAIKEYYDEDVITVDVEELERDSDDYCDDECNDDDMADYY